MKFFNYGERDFDNLVKFVDHLPEKIKTKLNQFTHPTKKARLIASVVVFLLIGTASSALAYRMLIGPVALNAPASKPKASGQTRCPDNSEVINPCSPAKKYVGDKCGEDTDICLYESNVIGNGKSLGAACFCVDTKVAGGQPCDKEISGSGCVNYQNVGESCTLNNQTGTCSDVSDGPERKCECVLPPTEAPTESPTLTTTPTGPTVTPVQTPGTSPTLTGTPTLPVTSTCKNAGDTCCSYMGERFCDGGLDCLTSINKCAAPKCNGTCVTSSGAYNCGSFYHGNYTSCRISESNPATGNCCVPPIPTASPTPTKPHCGNKGEPCCENGADEWCNGSLDCEGGYCENNYVPPTPTATPKPRCGYSGDPCCGTGEQWCNGTLDCLSTGKCGTAPTPTPKPATVSGYCDNASSCGSCYDVLTSCVKTCGYCSDPGKTGKGVVWTYCASHSGSCKN